MTLPPLGADGLILDPKQFRPTIKTGAGANAKSTGTLQDATVRVHANTSGRIGVCAVACRRLLRVPALAPASNGCTNTTRISVYFVMRLVGCHVVGYYSDPQTAVDQGPARRSGRLGRMQPDRRSHSLMSVPGCLIPAGVIGANLGVNLIPVGKIK